MGKALNDAYSYSGVSVAIFGILGNTLLVISIVIQRKLLEKNYYILVLHLAFSDLGYVIGDFVDIMNSRHFVDKDLALSYSTLYCFGIDLLQHVFQFTGVHMMLLIAVLRYRATVHPLKPAVSGRKFYVCCGSGYLIGLFAGLGIGVPECLLRTDREAYWMSRYSFSLFFYCAPISCMAVLYFKTCQALVRQNKHMKTLLSGAEVRRPQTTCSSYLKTSHFIQNRRAFLVSFVTVLCYGVGILPISVHRILKIAGYNSLLVRHDWIHHFANVFRVAGSHSINPLIYGIMDRKLLMFWRRSLKWKQVRPENGRA